MLLHVCCTLLVVYKRQPTDHPFQPASRPRLSILSPLALHVTLVPEVVPRHWSSEIRPQYLPTMPVKVAVIG